MDKVAVLGSGIFGFVLARHISLLHPGTDVFMYDVVDKIIDHLKQHRSHPVHLKRIRLPDNIHPTSDLKEAVDGASLIVAAVPAQFMRSACRDFGPHITRDVIILNVAKALELKSHKRMSEVFSEELKDVPHMVHFAMLSGGMIAQEVAMDCPLFAEVACEEIGVAEQLQHFLSSPTLRLYTNTDLIGVELAGAFKNVVSILAGISDGLGYAAGTKAALKAIASGEIEILAGKMGAKPHTFSNKTLAWEADLSTCVFGDSRNRYFGKLIGSGFSVKDALEELEQESKRAEGYATSKVIHEVMSEHGLDLPLLDSIYAVLYEGKSPSVAISELMTREYESIG
ncbi:NAD(P)-dependent glycerol-3-phosphate dehydrogenase [Candidatus Woesearchaeota archaeon]|nr:NAD(P)-dependent glycerol-3-phosphate dehydrogenase [Candidatus Woesearchaeota archaeon]